MTPVEILQRVAKLAGDAQHVTSIEVRTYGILIRCRAEHPVKDKLLQSGRSVSWSVAFEPNILEFELDACLAELDHALAE